MTTRKDTGVKKFTVKHIRSLSCPSHMKQFYAAVLPDVHLYVSIGRGGTKSFIYRCKHEGNWRTIDLDCKFDESLEDNFVRGAMIEAQTRASELTARKNRGENIFEQVKVVKTLPTLQELFDHYKAEHLEKKGKRVQENENNFKRWFTKRKLDGKKANEFSHADASWLHKQMAKTPGSANRAVQLGRAMFNHGIKTRFLNRTDNPFSGVSLYPENQRDRVLSDDEAGKLIQAISNVPMKHCQERTLADLILLWMLTGVRKTVMLSMEWAEIDEEAWVWRIPASKMNISIMLEI
jgi:integrase